MMDNQELRLAALQLAVECTLPGQSHGTVAKAQSFYDFLSAPGDVPKPPPPPERDRDLEDWAGGIVDTLVEGIDQILLKGLKLS